MNWNKYVGETVSILIIGKDEKTENYMGIIKEITTDDFMVLDPNNKNFSIKEITFHTSLIKSIWIYDTRHPLYQKTKEDSALYDSS